MRRLLVSIHCDFCMSLCGERVLSVCCNYVIVCLRCGVNPEFKGLTLEGGVQGVGVLEEF